MIYIGRRGWGDHYSIYEGVGRQSKLETYAGHFPIIELDSSFYAVKPISNMEKWASKPPDKFQFIVKAYQAMTSHQRWWASFATKEEMFYAFRESLAPLTRSNKLGIILCQFPPSFDCKQKTFI